VDSSACGNVMLELKDSFNPYTLPRLPGELSTDTRVTHWSQCSDDGREPLLSQPHSAHPEQLRWRHEGDSVETGFATQGSLWVDRCPVTPTDAC